jgi:hypothetical protein
MHKAGGVLVERPPALRGLTRNGMFRIRPKFYVFAASAVHVNLRQESLPGTSEIPAITATTY